MKTKLEEKKEQIGYIEGNPPSCGNCEKFTSIKKKMEYGYERETFMRCGTHGFATKKMSYCNDYKRGTNK